MNSNPQKGSPCVLGHPGPEDKFKRSDSYCEGFEVGYKYGRAQGASENPYVESEGQYDFETWEKGFQDGNQCWLEQQNLWRGIVP